MSSHQTSQIDPRLRDNSGTYPQRLSGTSASTSTSHTPIAANPSTSQLQSPNPNQAPHHQQYPPPPLQDIGSSAHYLPQTPQSTGHAGSDNDGGNDGSDPKRPRACEQCRGLKVRCEPDPHSDGPCKRCAKAGRNCIVTAPSRKRQKKTDSRVAELEKKIDALTASLHAKGASAETHNGASGSDGMGARHNTYQQVTNGGFAPSYTPQNDNRPPLSDYDGFPKSEFESKKLSAPPMVMAGQKSGQKRKHNDYPKPSASPMSNSGRQNDENSPYIRSAVDPALQKQAPTHEYADVVDRGLVTAEMANLMFTSYVEKMAPHLPAVIFPPGTTAAEVRKSQPTLFLSILSASSGMNYPALQKVLTKEVMSIYAERIVVNGEKTLELIQAIHVSTLWYWPPEHFEELKFYQLIHIAAVMAIDIGMGKRSKQQKVKYAGLWRDNPWRRTPYPDPESPEARRAWLACYFLCCNASMGLRRPNLIRWTPFMADCLDFFEISPEAAPSDKILCHWVRSQHIAEEVGTQFSMDDPMAVVSISDPKVQYALKGFERDLAKWGAQIPPEASTPDVRMTEHVVNLYIHEVSMHVDHNVEEFKPPFTEESIRSNTSEPNTDKLTPSHISALSICLSSIDGVFENFFSFDIDTIRCLPIFNFIRVAYAVVVLIKMYFAAATPGSELGNVIDKDNMKVEQYLDNLVDIFRSAAADEKSRPSAKFLMVLLMLKTWFHRQREGKSFAPETSSAGTLLTGDPVETADDVNTTAHRQNSKTQNGQQSFSPANTPLQLLSEVATGNSRGQSRPESANQYSASSNDWPQPQQPDYSNYDMNHMQGYTSVNMGNIDPALGMNDLGYNLGDGFEQAIGMSLGVGDFGGYFGDNAFFGNLMGGTTGFDGF